MQERRKHYSRNPTEPLSMTTKKEIVMDTTRNLETITTNRNCFLTTTELNVGRMSKHIVELEGKLYASEQRAAREEEDSKKLEEENTFLCLAHSSTKELQSSIKEEVETLKESMVVVYEEMMKLHKILSPFLDIQNGMKEKNAILKKATTAINNIHEWTKT